MYAGDRYSSGSGLGVAWLVPLIVSVGGAVGGALATRYIANRGQPTARDLDRQMREQQAFELERLRLEQQGGQQTLGYAVPLLGGLALLMLLR